MGNLPATQPNYGKKLTFVLILLIMSAFFFSGCSSQMLLDGDTPVDPLVPEGSSSGILGFFGNLTAGREVNDLVVGPDGDRVLVAPQDNKVYLLHQDGRILWEAPLGGEAFKLAPSPRNPSFGLVTREGKVVFFDDEFQLRAERDLKRNILDFAVSEDGVMAAALTRPPVEGAGGEEGLLHLMDNRGFVIWEVPVPLSPQGPYDLHLSREGEGILFIGGVSGQAALLWYDLQGELLWSKEGYSRAALSLAGDVVAAVQGPLLVVYDKQGNRKWGYDSTEVNLSHVMVSQNGHYVLGYSSYSTGQDNLFYFPARGETPPWKARVPAQSHIALSESGKEVVVTSWQHYLEDFTLVSVFNSQGEEVRALQMAGRGKKSALSPDGGTLVLSSDDGTIFFLDLLNESLADTHRTPRPPGYRPAAQGGGHSYVTLYFYNDTASELIPVSRKLPGGESTPERALQELIKGPRLGSGLSRTLPREVKVTAHIQGSTAFINLPGPLATLGGTAQMEGLANSLIYSFSHFPQISWVQFLVEGSTEGTPQGDIDFSRPIPVRRPGMSPGRQVLYTPVLSGSRYYLKVEEVALVSRDRADLAEKLLGKLLQDNRAFFPSDMDVNSVELAGDRAQVDFSANMEALGQLLLDPDRSELLLDAVTYTLSENFGLVQVEILINGLTSEETMPQLHRTIERPIFINPE